MRIKASRITNLTDARYFAAREVDFLGFNLESGTPGYLDPIYMKAIREWVEGPVIVGEFVATPPAVVSQAADFYGLTAVQLPAEQFLTDPGALEGLTVLLELPAAASSAEVVRDILRRAVSQAAYFIAYIGADDDPGFWREVCAAYPLLIQSDLPAAQWPALLTDLNPAGICVAGGEEEQVGVKSFDELDELFELPILSPKNNPPGRGTAG